VVAIALAVAPDRGAVLDAWGGILDAIGLG
jgi:hypothetical protein